MTPEAIKEREAIVAWLREQAARPDEPFGLEPMAALGLVLDMAAAYIEKEVHITETGE